jgi:hypothetical protein
LSERSFGEGLIGNIDVPSSANLEHLRHAFIDAAERSAREVQGIRADLASLGWSLDGIAATVWGARAGDLCEA